MSSKLLQPKDELKFQFKLNKEFENVNKLVEFLSNDEFMRTWHGIKVKVTPSEDKKSIGFTFRETFDYGETYNGFDMELKISDNKTVTGKITNAFVQPSELMDADIHEFCVYEALDKINFKLAQKGTLEVGMNDVKMMPFTGRFRDENSKDEFYSIMKGNENIKETTAILDGWKEDTALVLGNLNAEDMDAVFRPVSSFIVEKFKKETNNYLFEAQSNLSNKDMEMVINNLVDEIADHFDKTVAKIENGLRADKPFTMKYYECGGTEEESYRDKYIVTVYPTKIDGLFLSKYQMGNEIGTDKFYYDVISLDGKEIAERANNGKFKVKSNRIKKTSNLAPESKTVQKENVRK